MATRSSVGPGAETAIVVGFVALGIALRFQGIASHPLWIDEYGTWWAVAGEGLGELWHRVIAVHGQSPFYYAVVRLSVAALGPTPLALRLPSLLFGIGLLCLAFPLARALFGSRHAALASVAAFAVNERLIFYSQEARPYALALLCAALSCRAWLALLRDPRSPRARAAWLLATAASFYAHYLFGVLLLVQATHWLGLQSLRAWRGRRIEPLGSWIGVAATLAVLMVPGALQLVDLFERRELLDFVRPASPLRLLGNYFDAKVLAWTAGSSLAAAIAARGFSLPSRRSGTGLVLLWLALPFLAIGLLPPLFDISLLHRRYLVVALPAVALVYGLLMSLPARGSRLAWLPLGVFLAATTALSLAPRYDATGLFSKRYRSGHWATAVQSLGESHRLGEPIFYATHYVELDAVVLGRASDEDRDFSAWPVAAHLAPERLAALRPLPFRDSVELAPVFQARLDEASRAQRSWLIGRQPVVGHFLRLATERPGIEVVRHERYGAIHLVELRGHPALAPAAPPP